MTTVITRLYSNDSAARGIRDRLFRQGFPTYVVSLVTARAGDTDDAVRARIEQALVPGEAASAYATRVAEGAALVVVRATYKPLNAVRLAKETFDSSGALPVNLPSQSFKVRTPRDHAPSVMKDHPRFLTPAPGQDGLTSTLSERLGLRLLSPQKRRDSVIHGTKLIFGDGVSRKQRKLSVMAARPMSRLFWPMPLLSKTKRKSSVMRPGPVLSRWLGWPTT